MSTAPGFPADLLPCVVPAFGVQLHAPKPFDSFRSKVRYYFAGDTADGFVHLAWFNDEKHGRRIRLIKISREKFERYLTTDPPRLKSFDVQLELPEWLPEDEGINFQLTESDRAKKPKKTIKEACDARVLIISAAIEKCDEVLSSPNPIALLNQLAREAGSRAHPHRFQVWFFAYMLHGENIWALKRSRGETGKWDRTAEEHGDKKFGLPSGDGDSCFNSPGWKAHEEMEEFYLSKCGLGVSMRSMWIDFLLEKCACKFVTDAVGELTFTREDGGPIYSYYQFRDHIVEAFGLEAVQTARYGAPRQRLKETTNNGNYSSQYSRILEAMEVDAYFCAERPRVMIGEGPADPLVVAVGIDPKTSHATGVGFSIGAETQEAYRAMLFCSVAPRAYTERMYGLAQGVLQDWLLLGYPSNVRSDRGPGGVKGLVENLEARFPIKTVVPSSEPLSKATVEASNPRHTQLEGSPTYVLSALNTVQLIKREVLAVRLSTRKRNISNKLTDQEIHDFQREGRSATPHGYAEYLLKRLATAGRTMSMAHAVRALWTPIKFKVGADGVSHRHRIFTSEDYLNSDFRKRLGTREDEVPGYCLSAVFTIVWVELDGKLVEVEASSKAMQDAEDRMMPKAEVEAIDDQRKKLEARTRRSGAAAEAQTKQIFQDSEKVGWSAGERRSGTPKRGAGLAAQETAVMKGAARRRRA
jgi:hypothetical protein